MEERQPPEKNKAGQANGSHNDVDGSDLGQNSEDAVSPIEALKAELEAAKQEALANKDKYLRALAEAENQRRRAEKEKSDILQYGLERFINDLLPVLDSVDTAVTDFQSGSNLTVDSLKAGFELVKKQLTDSLAKQGLTQIQSEDAVFDPNVHQAIQRIESDTADCEKVKQVFVKGYQLNGRLIRAAMVAVEVPNN